MAGTDIRLISLSIKNFRGTESRDAVFNGKNANIYGDNFVGKTTVADACNWLLFGKNSAWEANFDIKPNWMTNPEVSVEGVISVSGKDIKLKRVLKEKWVKKRGTEESTFTGHETVCYINELERPISEYNSYLDTIVSEEKFKRLTSAKYFLDLKNPVQRAILLNMVGSVSNEEIAGNNPDFVELLKMMSDKDYTLDDTLKLAKQKISEYSSEMSVINPKIEEVTRSIPEQRDWAKIEEGLEKGRQYIRICDDKLTSSEKVMEDLRRKQVEVFALENRIGAYSKERLDQANKDYVNLLGVKQGIELQLQSIVSGIQMKQIEQSNISSQIDALTATVKDLQGQFIIARAARKNAAEQAFVPIMEGSVDCHSCGQSLPSDKISEINKNAEFEFNERRSSDMEKYSAQLMSLESQGKEKVAVRKELIVKIESIQSEMSDLESQKKIAISALADKERELEGHALAESIDLTGDPEFDKMVLVLKGMKSSITEPDTTTAAIREAKEKVVSQMGDLRKILEGKEQREKAEQRIEELTDKGRKLSGLIAIQKKLKDTCEQFSMAKSAILTPKVNGLFSNIEFKLFESQINGEVKECCIPLVHSQRPDGSTVLVEYNGASNSEKIRASQDIVRAMQVYEKTTIFVFVDNAEACTTLREMPCQVIKLAVSKKGDPFTLELEEN